MRSLLIILLSSISVQMFAQTITGKVTDESDEELVGATILIKGTLKGTISDLDGNFSIEAKPSDTLVISFTGYTKVELLVGSRTQINVQLQPDVELLDEVVVTAMNLGRSKESLTFAQQGVDVDDMKQAPDGGNFTSALIGKVAGMQVVAPANPTKSTRIILRGNSSLTQNNQPLFVVDGVPIDNSSTQLDSWNAGIDYGSNAATINPNDIEDIQILKGPNAAALYGSRAQNGVILITTKKGTVRDGVEVRFDSNVSTQFITEYPEFQNLYGFGNADRFDNIDPDDIPDSRLPGANDRSYGPLMSGFPYINLQGDTIPYSPQPNNIRDFFQKAWFITNGISIEGGTPTARILANYTNFHGNTVIPKMNLNNRHVMNLRATLTPAKKIRLDTRIMYLIDEVKNRQQNNGNPRNPIFFWTEMPRNTRLQDLIPWKDENGVEIASPNNNEFKNPYWAINQDPNEDRRDRIQGFVNFKYDLLEDLIAEVQVSSDVIFHNGFQSIDIGSTMDLNGMYQTFQNKRFENNYEGRMTYSGNIQKIGFQVATGVVRSDRIVENYQQRVDELIVPEFYSLSNSTVPPAATRNYSRKVINSIWGSLNMNYSQFIFLDFTARNDWSSTLPAQNRSFFYPSVGLTFVPTKLAGVQWPSQLNSLKFRANWAQVGNDTNPYNLYDVFYFNPSRWNGITTSNSNTVRRNPNFKPESTASLEFGVDGSLFQDRLDFSLTYYKSNTVDQIIQADVSSTSGYSSAWLNAGEVENKGVEVGINFNVMDKNKFSWDVSANYAKNKSLVVSINDYTDEVVLQSWNGDDYISVVAQVGQPYGVMKGRVWLTNESGQKVVQGPNEPNPGQPIATNESHVIGNSNPDWLGSLTNTFKYKNLTLRMMIDVKWGGDIKSQSFQKAWTNGVTVQSLNGREDYWLHQYAYGENSAAQELNGGIIHANTVYRVFNENGEVVGYEPNTDLYYTPSAWHKQWVASLHERTIWDATSVKLRELALNYTFPKKVMNYLPFARMSAGVFGRNLWLIYHNTPKGLDPESSVNNGNGQGIEFGAQPFSSTYGASINITF